MTEGQDRILLGTNLLDMLCLGIFQASRDEGQVSQPQPRLIVDFELIECRSYYEIDVMFERKVSARKFKDYVVEMDADEQMRREQGLGRS